MSCPQCKGPMKEGHSKDILGPRGVLSLISWRCLDCGHAVDFMKGSVGQPKNCKGSLVAGLCFLLLAPLNLLGCAMSGEHLSGEQVIAAERQKLEAALTKQAAASLAERQKLEKAHTETKEALTKQTALSQELDGKLAKLQLLSLEKELQKKELNAKLEEAMLEVVRAKAKLRSLETKAETVSALAEGEIALKTLRSNGPEQENDVRVNKADELLKASAAELKKENFSGALYLATQAKTLIREDQERSKDREKKTMMAGELPFAMPLPLQTVSATKVKEGPSLDSKALFAVQQGTPFVGYSFKGPWVRVRAEDGRSGWIYYKQVDGR
jgi:Bacterial SH3 domain